MYLLNVQPFLADNLQKISAELQGYSSKIHSVEQSKYSERAHRINSGHASTQPPRSLVELTGEKNVFAYIHSHFAWILWMGARCLTENISIGLPLLSNTNTKLDPFSVIQLKNKESMSAKRFFIENDNDQVEFIRKCQRILNDHFPAACYCTLVGIQVRLTCDILCVSFVISTKNLPIKYFTDCFKGTTVHYGRLYQMLC